MKNFTVLLLVCLSNFLMAQTTADFEGLLTQPETFLNGIDGNGGYASGNIFLPNIYDDIWDSWTGWSISNTTDTVTSSFVNQYSSISGSGNGGSEGYAVAYVVGESLLHTTGIAEGGVVEGFYINNGTYAYRVMEEGNQFAKRFGGEDGTDPDYFYVTIKEYGDRNVVNDSINVFLADYRSSDPAEDYILSNWTYVDLTRFENVDTLSFTMHSSDVGMFGINTPTYFCMDDFTTADMALTSTDDEHTEPLLQLYPNPAEDYLQTSVEASHFKIFDIQGRQIAAGLTSHTGEISVKDLYPGLHFIKITDKTGNIVMGRFYKK